MKTAKKHPYHDEVITVAELAARINVSLNAIRIELRGGKTLAEAAEIIGTRKKNVKNRGNTEWQELGCKIT